jgi:hypothetical protein
MEPNEMNTELDPHYELFDLGSTFEQSGHSFEIRTLKSAYERTWRLEFLNMRGQLFILEFISKLRKKP